MQRSELTEVPRPGLAPVALDHRVPIVTRAVRDPRLGLARGEGDGHERGPQVVGTEALACLGALEELRALDTDAAKVVADLLRQVLDVPR